ncbi:MAG: carbohydrate ABC transporter permease [Halobacteriaceae archaeon]
MSSQTDQGVTARLRRNEYLEYWFALPAILSLLALVIIPMLWSLYVSFTNLDLTVPNQTVRIVGIENYADILTNGRFWNSITNTAYYVGVGVTIQFAIGFAVALFMANYTRGILNRILFTTLLLPMMMAPIVAGYMWRLIFQESFGPLNYLIGAAGFTEPSWISSADLALTSVMIADIWQWTPFMILILYTGRLAINEDLYEAARMDGAGRWFTFRHVTLPQMKGVVAVALLLRAMDAFKFFDKMFVITAGGPGTASELATYYNYILGLRQFSMGKATAVSWLLLLIAVVLANLFLYVLEQGEGGDRVI